MNFTSLTTPETHTAGTLFDRVHLRLIQAWLVALRADDHEVLDWYSDGLTLIEEMIPDAPVKEKTPFQKAVEKGLRYFGIQM